MATPDPYQQWSGAPNRWVHVPAQRRHPPASEQLDAAARDAGAGASRGEWSVAAVAVAVAVAAFVLIGTGSAVTDCDRMPEQRTDGTSTR